MKLNLADIVFLIFMTLKLTGHIDWSWWWVTAPLWGSAILRVIINISAKDQAPKPSRWRTRLDEMQAEQKAQREARLK
jgi:hypothetical protein